MSKQEKISSIATKELTCLICGKKIKGGDPIVKQGERIWCFKCGWE